MANREGPSPNGIYPSVASEKLQPN